MSDIVTSLIQARQQLEAEYMEKLQSIDQTIAILSGSSMPMAKPLTRAAVAAPVAATSGAIRRPGSRPGRPPGSPNVVKKDKISANGKLRLSLSDLGKDVIAVLRSEPGRTYKLEQLTKQVCIIRGYKAEDVDQVRRGIYFFIRKSATQFGIMITKKDGDKKTNYFSIS